MSFFSRASQQKNGSRILFATSGAISLASSGLLFRDLADLSQWVLKTDRNDVFKTFQNRHKLAVVAIGSMAINTYVTFGMKPKRIPTPAWSILNCDAVFVSSSDILTHLKRNETVIVVNGLDNNKDDNNNKVYYAFPDSQALRPHVVRLPSPAGRRGGDHGTTQRTLTYCGLTNLGMVFDIAKHPNKDDVELIPMTQLENNLVLLDKTTGNMGQQINGIDEVSLLKKKGGDDFQTTKRRPTTEELSKLNLNPSQVFKEVATWRMNLGDFVRTYPTNGEIFLNDYKMFKDNIKAPIKSLYDKIMDMIFETTVDYQATNPNPVFPTLDNIDPRLPSKELVLAFNVGDDYVAVTETFVRDGTNGTRNIKVNNGSDDIVASWDPNSNSLGIFKNTTGRPIKQPINVHGEVQQQGGRGSNNNNSKVQQLERLNTVKSGAFWCVVANFFPHIRVNPES